MARRICRYSRKQCIYIANASAAFATSRSNTTGFAFELYSDHSRSKLAVHSNRDYSAFAHRETSDTTQQQGSYSAFAHHETSDPTQQQGSYVKNAVQDKHRKHASI